MKSMKHIALSLMVTLSVFGAVLYTSCVKQSCKGVTCLNGGTCSGNVCTCPPGVSGNPSGIGGNNCETIYRQLYTNNTYAGVATYYNKTIKVDSVTFRDSTYVIAADTGNTLTFVAGSDSLYARMSLSWNRPGQTSASTTLTLTKNSATGSSFTVDDFHIDSFTCTGSGNITATTASLNLTATPPHSPAIVITLNNFTRR